MTIALENVVALVTGANGGIGRAVCKAMTDAGATVIGTDLQDGPADGLVCEAYRKHDVTSADDWRAVETMIADRWGRLDALVNNAGLSIVTKFEDTPLEDFHRVNAVNVDSAIIGIQTMLDLLKAGGKNRRGGSSVVNFSSIGGLRGAPFNAAYCTSKAAIAMLTKCLGAEFGALGYPVRVNSIHPGGVDTPMLNSIMDRYVELGAAPSREAAAEGVIGRHPIGRLGQPEDLSGGVVFLCSEAAAFMTCDELVIDGGFAEI